MPLLLLATLSRRLRPVTPVVWLAISAVATWVHGRFLILLVLFSFLVGFQALGALDERYRLMRARSAAQFACAGRAGPGRSARSR